MPLPGLIYRGAPLDDVAVLERLPAEYAQLLAQRNGFVALGGALHVRGACIAPAWHSLSAAMEGTGALHRLFREVAPTDIPFGQTAVGDQLLLRDDQLFQWTPGEPDPRPLGRTVTQYHQRVLEDPAALLPLEELAAFRQSGGHLAAGELLVPDRSGWRVQPMLERLRDLAGRADPT
jgi:hypothetical protein